MLTEILNNVNGSDFKEFHRFLFNFHKEGLQKTVGKLEGLKL